MARKTNLFLPVAALYLASASQGALGQELIPPLAGLKPDHPRVFLRPRSTPLAISVPQLRALERDRDFGAMLEQLKRQDNAAAQAMVWLLTDDPAAAQKAIARLRSYRFPGKVDTFHIFGRLSEFGLAYDWLYDCPLFTNAIKAEVRSAALPLAREAIRATNDHMFHNYIWMSAGGLALWAIATAGEDPEATAVFQQIRTRFNDGLFPAFAYLDGLPSEPMGYWSLYVFTPCVYTVLAAQSAYETDIVGAIRKKQNAWLDRHFENLIHSTLPDMRYIPWGDLQGGPNGGVTMEMACVIDAATWALKSPHGRYFGDRLAAKRGLSRFYGETAIFYMLYTRHLPADLKPAAPPLDFLAGNRQSGHFIARSSWDDSATIVAFTCTDHFGDHHHYDQGSFIIYRRGLLAVDPPVYRQVRGPQQKTEHHNTLLINGKPQRPARGQWFRTIGDFKKNLNAGPKLETGNICFLQKAEGWSAVAGEFAQAYDCPELASCVRQLLFIRPDKVVVVDRLVAQPGKQLGEVTWLLQVPSVPKIDANSAVASNGKNSLRCRPIFPGSGAPAAEATPVNTHRLAYTYPGGKSAITLVHVIDVGDGQTPPPASPVKASQGETGALDITIAGQTFHFSPAPEFSITAISAP